MGWFTVKVFLLLVTVVTVFGHPGRNDPESGLGPRRIFPPRFARSPSPHHEHGHHDYYHDYDHHHGHDHHHDHDHDHHHDHDHDHHHHGGHDHEYDHGHHGEHYGDYGHEPHGHHGNYGGYNNRGRIQPYGQIPIRNSGFPSSSDSRSGSITRPFGSGSFSSSKSTAGFGELSL